MEYFLFLKECQSMLLCDDCVRRDGHRAINVFLNTSFFGNFDKIELSAFFPLCTNTGDHLITKLVEFTFI
jgi:hypothetical protein